MAAASLCCDEVPACSQHLSAGHRLARINLAELSPFLWNLPVSFAATPSPLENCGDAKGLSGTGLTHNDAHLILDSALVRALTTS